MSYAPRRFEDDIYPEDDDFLDWPADMLEADPDLARDLAMEREWAAEALKDLDDQYMLEPDPDLAMEREWAAETLMDLDDQREWGYGGKTGGYVDTYMVDTYGGAK